MSVIPRPPPLAAFRPVKAAASWPVRQRRSPLADGACTAVMTGPAAATGTAGWGVAAGAALAAAVLADAADEPVAAWRAGEALPEQAATSSAGQATAKTAARPRTGGLPPRTEVITLPPGVLRGAHFRHRIRLHSRSRAL